MCMCMYMCVYVYVYECMCGLGIHLVAKHPKHCQNVNQKPCEEVLTEIDLFIVKCKK